MRGEQEHLEQLGYSFELDPGPSEAAENRFRTATYTVLVRHEGRPIGQTKAKSSQDALREGIQIANNHASFNADQNTEAGDDTKKLGPEIP